MSEHVVPPSAGIQSYLDEARRLLDEAKAKQRQEDLKRAGGKAVPRER